MKRRRCPLKELRIDYENGSIILIPENYFPVSQRDAGKIFKLINRYCTEETRQELKEFLENKAEKYKSECKASSDKAVFLSPYEKKYMELKARFKKNKALYERTLRNLKLIETD